MNKNIIAIAIATAMAAPVAMADVKVSGRVGGHLTINEKAAAVDDAGTAGVNESKASRDFGDAGHSRLQFDGTSGDGFARIALDARNWMGGVAGAAPREVLVGYKLGGGSSVSFGRMGGVAKNLEKDPYIATFLQTRNGTAEATTAKQYGSSSFVGNVMQFAMKTGGMSIKAQYDPTDNSASANDGHIGVSLAGKAGAMNYWVSYNNGTANNGAAGTSANAVNAKVGAAMKFGSVKVTLNVTDAQNGTGANKTTATTVWADMGLGGGLSVNVGYAANGDKGTWLRAAVNKKLNKGTSVYAGLVTTTPAGSTTGKNVIGAGMVVKF